MAEIKCAKCGGNNELDSATKFMRCKYCDSQMYIDKSSTGFYYILPYQPGFLSTEQVQGTFRRWTAGPSMAKDLEVTARVTSLKQQYFPVYMFKRKVGDAEQVFVQPAKSTTLPGMRSLKVPAGDIKIFDQKYDYNRVELAQPDIAMGAYLNQLPGTPLEQSLVYFPIWNITYDFKGRQFQAVVDGSSGEVFATEYPPRAEAPFLLIGIGGFAAFFAEGLVAFFASAIIGGVLMLATMFGILFGSYFIATRC